MTGMVLPDDIEISERSRKFYDGTYTLTSDGFTDEAGGDCTIVTTNTAIQLTECRVSRFRLLRS
jgi:hypothetical protein